MTKQHSRSGRSLNSCFLKLRWSWLILFSVFLGCQKDPEFIAQISEEQDFTAPYSFFVAGHTYGSPYETNEGLHPPFENNFNLIQYDSSIQFGFFTGDIVKTPSEEAWEHVDTSVTKIGVPVYFAAGNHEYKDKALFVSRYGPRTYYHFTHENDLFIVLDPNLDHWNISGEQLEYLKRVVKENQDVNHIFVFFHQLLWWDKDNQYKNVPLNSKEDRADTINFWSEVKPVFPKENIETYFFAGDMGAVPDEDGYMYDHYANTTLIGSGMGGKTEDNFIVVNVDRERVRFQLIALNGDDVNAFGELEDYELP